jgi:hypothetical protein
VLHPARLLPKILNFLASSDTSPTLEGYCRASMGYVVSGNLTLNSAVLYVDGDLTVNGAIMGTGAIFVTGRTTVNAAQQASDLSADNVVALASLGDVTLTAQSRANNFFRGVIYTEGNFTASHISLMGSFVARPIKTATPPR